jgi:hypothetical protein
MRLIMLVVLALAVAFVHTTPTNAKKGMAGCAIKVATYNVGMSYDTAGGLVAALQDPAIKRLQNIAEIIQRRWPHLVQLCPCSLSSARARATIFSP